MSVMDPYRKLAAKTLGMPNRQAWEVITERLRITGHRATFSGTRDAVWEIRAEMLAAEPQKPQCR